MNSSNGSHPFSHIQISRPPTGKLAHSVFGYGNINKVQPMKKQIVLSAVVAGLLAEARRAFTRIVVGKDVCIEFRGDLAAAFIRQMASASWR